MKLSLPSEGPEFHPDIIHKSSSVTFGSLAELPFKNNERGVRRVVVVVGGPHPARAHLLGDHHSRELNLGFITLRALRPWRPDPVGPGRGPEWL